MATHRVQLGNTAKGLQQPPDSPVSFVGHEDGCKFSSPSSLANLPTQFWLKLQLSRHSDKRDSLIESIFTLRIKWKYTSAPPGVSCKSEWRFLPRVKSVIPSKSDFPWRGEVFHWLALCFGEFLFRQSVHWDRFLRGKFLRYLFIRYLILCMVAPSISWAGDI